MPKLKGEDLAGFDPEELDVEWSETDFDTYEGEDPPSGTVLKGHVKKLWWTYASDETPMIKVLWVASGNVGSNAEYNGLPVWDNLVFKPSAAFKYGPFLQATGVTLRDIKTRTIVAEDDDNMGAPIEKIGKFAPGEDAECGIVTKREKYQGNWSTKVGKFIEQPDDEDDDEDEPEETPARSRRKSAASKPAAKPAARSRRRPEPEPEDDDEDDVDEDDVDEDADDEADDEPDDEPDERPARRTRSSARSKPAAKTRAPAKSRSRKAADDDDEDEPF